MTWDRQTYHFFFKFFIVLRMALYFFFQEKNTRISLRKFIKTHCLSFLFVVPLLGFKGASTAKVSLRPVYLFFLLCIVYFFLL